MEDDLVEDAVDHRGCPISRSRSGQWISALFIIVVEIAERFAYYDVSANLITYATGPLHEPVAAAAAAVNTWSGVSMVLPLLGAFLADSYVGRYRMISAASLLYILIYRYNLLDQKNPFLRIAKTLILMAKSRLPSNKSRPTGEEGEFRLSEESNPSRLQLVEEAKGVLRLFPIWSACLMFAVVFAQSSTFFTKQGATLNRSICGRFNLPPAALQSIIGITVLIFMPVYDRVFVSITRKFSWLSSAITMLQRIGIGMFLSMISMVIAALVEMKRLKTAKDYGLSNSPKATIPMSLGWMTPQYVLFGLADVFTLVGLQEFFYDQVPDTLRTLGLALYLCILGIGSFISSLLISVINKVTSKSGIVGSKMI